MMGTSRVDREDLAPHVLQHGRLGFGRVAACAGMEEHVRAEILSHRRVDVRPHAVFEQLVPARRDHADDTPSTSVRALRRPDCHCTI